MEKKTELKNELELIKEYSQFFDSTKGTSYFNQNQQPQWRNEGDNFEIFSLLERGKTIMSSETELLDT